LTRLWAGFVAAIVVASALVAIVSGLNPAAPIYQTKCMELPQASALTSRVPIYIDGNADFNAAHGVTGGIGTQVNPWVIENYDIDGIGYGYCFDIRNTTEFFVVRNCSFHGATENFQSLSGVGIVLKNVTNGIISNNNASMNGGYGISLEFSKNNSVSNNTASRNGDDGIELFFSDGNVISHNTLSLNAPHGLVLSSSNNNVVHNNTISNHNVDGISIWSSINNTISKNKMENDIVNFGGNLPSYWTMHNVGTSNTVNGRPIYYFKNQNVGTVLPGAGEILLANCSNFVVEDQNVSNGAIGIILGFSTNNLVKNNAAYDNIKFINMFSSSSNTIANNVVQSNDYGFYLENSNDNHIIGNIVSRNFVGFTYYSSSNNSISNNTMLRNINGGMSFCSNSNNNSIYHNNFINNNNTYSISQAYDYGHNYWDAAYTIGGNYWSDYSGIDVFSGSSQNLPGSDGIGDTPYTNISGNIGEMDNYPLMVPMDSEAPNANAGLNQTVFAGSLVQFNGSASTDNIGIANYSWTFNVSSGDVIIYGVLTAYNFMIPGIHSVILNVTDLTGNWGTDNITITVLDMTPPTANAGTDQSIDEGNIAIFNGSESTDNVDIVNYSWSFNDGIDNVSLYGISSSHTFSLPGIYSVSLNVTDAADNWDMDSMIITVLDITSPTANAGPDQIVNESAMATFDGSASTDNIGIVNYTWDFTHNASQLSLYNVGPTFQFWAPGNYTVTLTVKDAAGNSQTDALVVNVVANDVVENEVPPVDNVFANYWWVIAIIVVVLAVALIYYLKMRGPKQSPGNKTEAVEDRRP